jgi:hypothetical protein
MSTDTAADEKEEPTIAAVADRHERLQDRAVALDAVEHADAVCAGARNDDTDPAFRTELVLDSDHDVVPPTVLEAIAVVGLGIAGAPTQGAGEDAQLIVHAEYQ